MDKPLMVSKKMETNGLDMIEEEKILVTARMLKEEKKMLFSFYIKELL
jgi:hypothetical protein